MTSSSGCHALVAANTRITPTTVVGDVSMPRVRPLSTHFGMATRADYTPQRPIPRTAREAMAPSPKDQDHTEAP